MEIKNKLHWLHFSDLHRGQERTSEVWSVVRQEIHDDIKRQVNNRGPIDLVVFSGDLAFKGEIEEFLSVKEEIERLWEVFSESGSNPVLFVVPGNHDLVRPAPTSPLRNMADILRIKQDVRNAILTNNSSSYRDEAEKAFANYRGFIESLRSSSIPLASDQEGLLPGDVSAQISVNGLKVGLVGLNSAWTHLSSGDAVGKLDMSVRQLNSVVDSDLPKWPRKNNVNFLVTHHPANWLCQAAQEEFEGEIFNPDYFDVHLFGHMHENRPIHTGTGAHNRRTMQASSLFGLEEFEDSKERRHGYYFAILDANEDSCEYWPRKFEKKHGGVWQVSRDGEMLRRDENFYKHEWVVKKIEGKELKKV